MKKLIAILILTTLLLSACGNTSNESTKNSLEGINASDTETSQNSPYLNAQDEN